MLRTIALFWFVTLSLFCTAAFAQDCIKPAGQPVLFITGLKTGVTIKGSANLDVVIDGVDAKPKKARLKVNERVRDLSDDLKLSPEDGPFRRILSLKLSFFGTKEGITLQQGRNTFELTVWDENERCNTQTRIFMAYKGEIHAIVVGISNYDKVRHLTYADEDSRAFKKHLMNVLGVPEKRIQYLENQEATKRNIGIALDTVLQDIGENDTLIFFFSGHGFYSPITRLYKHRAYFIPYDAQMKSETTLYPQTEILDRLEQAPRNIYFIDACFSGAKGSKSMSETGSKIVTTDLWPQRQGTFGIVSSKENQASAEDEDLKHGIFTYYLIKAFSDAPDNNKDGMISLREVYEYIKVEIDKFIKLKNKDEQEPLINDQGDMDDLPFGYRTATAK